MIIGACCARLKLRAGRAVCGCTCSSGEAGRSTRTSAGLLSQLAALRRFRYPTSNVRHRGEARHKDRETRRRCLIDQARFRMDLQHTVLGQSLPFAKIQTLTLSTLEGACGFYNSQSRAFRLSVPKSSCRNWFWLQECIALRASTSW